MRIDVRRSRNTEIWASSVQEIYQQTDKWGVIMYVAVALNLSRRNDVLRERKRKKIIGKLCTM